MTLFQDAIKVISFDADGTLATTEFANAIWQTEIPRLYAKKNKMSFIEAKRHVFAEYQKVGEHRVEWYDAKYWFHRFGLGHHQPVFDRLSHKIAYYPEVEEVLASLSQRYQLIIASNSPRYYLELLLAGIEGYFRRIFSSVSDYNEIKKEAFFLRVCREMEVKPQQLVHVGDHFEFDFIVPKQAGITAFFLDRNKQREEGVTDLKEFAANFGLS
jgi:HAD superfamily hydrolase (TIGR01549 family)